MKLIKSVLFFLLLLISFNTYLTYAFAEKEECNQVNKLLIKNTEEIFNYQESRNDIGIFYDFAWDEKNKKIIIKRNDDDYPIVRFSLFDKKNIEPGSVIKTYNNIDLSKKSDGEIEELHKNTTTVNLELSSGKKVIINPKPYKKNEFKLSHFKIKSVHNIDTAKGILEIAFESFFTNRRKDFENDLVKKIDDIDNLSWQGPVCNEVKEKRTTPIQTIEFNEYKYDVDIREGKKNKEKLEKSFIDITIDNGKVRTIRKEEGVGFFRQNFDFRKFPFDVQKLIITINSGASSTSDANLNSLWRKHPAVTFITPDAGPFIGLEFFMIPENNYLREWIVVKEKTTIKSAVKINDNFYDKWLDQIISDHENILNIEITIKRNWPHYFFKIILPVFLILCVAWYILWIPTRKYETRLNTSIIALLALIAYNFVFQDDIPKLEYLTDLDWYILLSYVFCCIPVFISIGSSKLGTKNQKAIIKINKYIRKWGILAYILITLTIFKFT